MTTKKTRPINSEYDKHGIDTTSTYTESYTGPSLFPIAGLLAFIIIGYFIYKLDAPSETEKIESEAISACRSHHVDRDTDLLILGGQAVSDYGSKGYHFVELETNIGPNAECIVSPDGTEVIGSSY